MTAGPGRGSLSPYAGALRRGLGGFGMRIPRERRRLPHNGAAPARRSGAGGGGEGEKGGGEGGRSSPAGLQQLQCRRPASPPPRGASPCRRMLSPGYRALAAAGGNSGPASLGPCAALPRGGWMDGPRAALLREGLAAGMMPHLSVKALREVQNTHAKFRMQLTLPITRSESNFFVVVVSFLRVHWDVLGLI